jgi:hypothetical protein
MGVCVTVSAFFPSGQHEDVRNKQTAINVFSERLIILVLTTNVVSAKGQVLRARIWPNVDVTRTTAQGIPKPPFRIVGLLWHIQNNWLPDPTNHIYAVMFSGKVQGILLVSEHQKISCCVVGPWLWLGYLWYSYFYLWTYIKVESAWWKWRRNVEDMKKKGMLQP